GPRSSSNSFGTSSMTAGSMAPCSTSWCSRRSIRSSKLLKVALPQISVRTMLGAVPQLSSVEADGVERLLALAAAGAGIGQREQSMDSRDLARRAAQVARAAGVAGWRGAADLHPVADGEAGSGRGFGRRQD